MLSLKTKVTFLMLMLFLCNIWLLTFVISKRLEHEMTIQIEAEQFSTASYIADSIQNQVKTRFSVLNGIASQINSELIRTPGRLIEYLQGRTFLKMLFQTGVEVISREGIGIAHYPVLPERAGGLHKDLDFIRDVVSGC